MGVGKLPLILSRANLAALGVSRHRLYAMVRAGELEQIAPGVFIRPGVLDDTTAAWASIGLRNASATICLLSALALHELVDDVPAMTDIALPRGERTLATTVAKVRWHSFDRSTFELGRGLHHLPADGLSIGLYSPERTIIDAFRLRHEIGSSTANESLRRWLGRQDSVPASLLELAQAFPQAAPALRSTLQILLPSPRFISASLLKPMAQRSRSQNGIAMSATLFGSISTVADTSELQRAAFNQAFKEHGLDWHWQLQDYRAMLATSGGNARIAAYAHSLGQDVDAAAIHQSKSRIFQESLANTQLAPRAGVVETIKNSKSNGWKVGLVTTTSRENVRALLDALSPAVSSEDFDVIVAASDVQQPKPDKAAYAFALHSLDEQAGDCVAIEDNIEGVQSAVAAGLVCVAFPNENTAAHEFTAARRRVERLDAAELQGLLQAS